MESIQNILFSLVMFIIMIGIIVAVHEGGHFLIGRLSGIRILEYCIGFGKKPIFQRKMGRDQTLITIRLFPIGGFVKPLQEPKEGDTPERKFWDSLPEEEKNRALERVSRWRRALMVFGGPAFNFILAFIVLFGAYTVVGEKIYKPLVSEVVEGSVFEKAGIKSGDEILKINGKVFESAAKAHEEIIYTYIKGGELSIETSSGKATSIFTGKDLGEFSNPSEKIGIYVSGKIGDVVIQEILKDSVAERAGLKEGDIIQKIDGVEMHNTNRIINLIGYSKDEGLLLEVKRNNEVLSFNIIPEVKKDLKRKIIGVNLEVNSKIEPFVQKYGVMEATSRAYDKVISSTKMQAVAIKKLIVGDLSYKNLSSPIAMADFSGLTAKQGLFQYLNYIALISIAVGIFNLLPIPVLDGGHLIILAVEGIRRKDLSQKTMFNLQKFGLAMIMSVFAVALINDIIKYIV